MTSSATGNWTFVAIGTLYALSVLAYATRYVSMRDSSAACIFTTAWMVVWCVLYSTWWATVCAACAVVFFGWQWYRADDEADT